MTKRKATPTDGTIPPANRWANRIIRTGDEAPDQLLANPLNFRIHPGDQAAALAGAMGTLGWLTPIIVNDRTGHVVDGHLRVRLALQRGESTVPVTYVDLSPDEERLALATLDPISAMAGEDADLLRQLLDGLEVEDAALAEHLANLHPDGTPQGKEPGGASTPSLPPVPITFPGELIELGEHRLLCGDSTNPEHVRRLLGDLTTVDMVFTDPPYAIFGSSTGVKSDVADDKMVRPFFREVLRACKGALKPYGHLYVCCDWRSWSAWWSVAGEVELAVKNAIVWDKGGGMGGMYMNAHEWLLFASNAPRLKSTGEKRSGERTVPDMNVWRISRANKEEQGEAAHNAQKPIALVARAIENSTDLGQTVLDLFGGSGTTLLACETLARRCRMMEVDPAWCDVILERWETATGLLARRIPPAAQ